MIQHIQPVRSHMSVLVQVALSGRVRRQAPGWHPWRRSGGEQRLQDALKRRRLESCWTHCAGAQRALFRPSMRRHDMVTRSQVTPAAPAQCRAPPPLLSSPACVTRPRRHRRRGWLYTSPSPVDCKRWPLLPNAAVAASRNISRLARGLAGGGSLAAAARSDYRAHCLCTAMLCHSDLFPTNSGLAK